MAEDRHGRPAPRPVLFGGEEPALLGDDTHDVEVRRLDLHPRNALTFPIPGKAEHLERIGRRARQRRDLRTDVRIVRVREGVEAVPLGGAPELHDPIGLADPRDRPEEDRAHDVEDRGVRPDADGEGEGGHQGEDRAAADLAHRVAQIEPETFHGCPGQRGDDLEPLRPPS